MENVVPKTDAIIFQSKNQRDERPTEHQGSHGILININRQSEYIVKN